MDGRDAVGRGFWRLCVRIRNCGVSLHEVGAEVWFRREEGGTQRVALTPKGSRNELARGMIAEFELESRTLHEWGVKMLLDLTDLRRQEAALVIRSQGHEAARFTAGTSRDRWDEMMNRLASAVSLHNGHVPLDA